MPPGAARLTNRLGRLAFAGVSRTPVYRVALLGRTPSEPTTIPPDPWPGDPEAGARIISGRLPGDPEPSRGANAPWASTDLPPSVLATLHGFAWLRDLRTLGGDIARRRARELVGGWLARHGRWSAVAWRTEILANRIVAWLTHYDAFFASAEDGFRTMLRRSLGAQLRHLARAERLEVDGAARIAALKALVYGGACFAERRDSLARVLRRLETELARQILPDGGHVERSPALQFRVLRDLVDIRTTLGAARIAPPESVQEAIDRMAPMLRFFRHRDGGLALFNDSREGDPDALDLVLAQADARGRPPRNAPHTGFARLAAGRTLALVDAGAPPPPGLDGHAHAGTLSLEMSVGRERLIVNCGAAPEEDPRWRQAQRATAAHSTLAVADTNSSAVRPEGGLARRPRMVALERRESEAGIWLETSHDGYLPVFGLVHRRRLYLAATGDDLRGEDVLEGPADKPFALRFHLHPRVSASTVQGGGAVLLRLPRGGGWRFQAAGGRIRLEDSVYFGAGKTPARTRQIVVEGSVANGGGQIKWALRRVGEN